MDLNSAFDDLQQEVNANPRAVDEARRRRDLFCDAFDTEEDVAECFPSGSLARGSQIEPINDVDIVIVYRQSAHPDWGDPGASASEALDHVQSRVRSLLGNTEGTIAQEIRLAKPRNHAVKCWLDDPDEEGAFTVDVTPALRQEDGTLLIPEKRSRKWIPTDPQDLIRRVAQRHREWAYFVPMVRDLKRWGRDKSTGMKPLALEVLALDYLPAKDRPNALASFFAAAVVAIDGPIEDPAGLCGEIQPDLDRATARKHLEKAADTAWRAVKAADEGDTDGAACLWREIFGKIFPEPPGGCGKKAVVAGAAAATLIRPRPVRDAPQG